MVSDTSSAGQNNLPEQDKEPLTTKIAEAETQNNPQNGGFTALFIRRPVFAFVLNVLIVVAGLAALTGVDIRELPDVDRPVISISTTFNGASAKRLTARSRRFWKMKLRVFPV